MTIDFVKPSVRVTSITNAAPAAWRNSRPNSDEPYTKTMDWDVSIHDLCTVVTEFDASAGLREILTVLRPSSCWATSSRNRFIDEIGLMDYSEIGCSTDYKSMWVESVENSIELSKKKHQDVGRLYLPLSHHAPFTYQCSWRTALSIIKTMQEIAPHYYTLYGKRWLEQLGVTEEQLAKSPYKSLHKQYCLQDPAMWSDGTSTSFAGIRIVNCKINIGLRAQLVRQMQVRVYDDMFSRLQHSMWEYESTNLLQCCVS